MDSNVCSVLSIAQEVRGDEQIDCLQICCFSRFESGQLVSRQLLADELVERLVGVQRTDDVIAVTPGVRPVGVGAEIAVGIGVAGGIKPVFPPPLSETRRRQIPLDHLFIRSRRSVVQKLFDRIRRRRQPGHIEADTANQRPPIGCRTNRQLLLLKPRLYVPIDGIPQAFQITNGGQRGICERAKRPVNASVTQ